MICVANTVLVLLWSDSLVCSPFHFSELIKFGVSERIECRIVTNLPFTAGSFSLRLVFLFHVFVHAELPSVSIHIRLSFLMVHML